MVGPRSVLLRSGFIILFFLSAFLFFLSIIIFSTTGLSYLTPAGDDMGGEGDWTELMMLGSLFTSLLINALFVARAGISKLKQPLHLAYYIGFDLFACLFLLGIWHTSLFMSHFVFSTGCQFSFSEQYGTTNFFCHPSFEVCRGLFMAGYAFALILAILHGALFAIAARKLDLKNRAKKRECLGRGVDNAEDEIELV